MRFPNIIASLFALSLLTALPPASAEDFNLGATNCEECHQAEYDVWASSPHEVSFEKFDDPSVELSDTVESILDAVGDEDMTESATCTVCHFTLIKEEPDEEAYVDSGPSCESCHGAASGFRDIHSEKEDDYDTRMAESEGLGMIRPHMKLAIANNCNGCHAMARDEIDGATITAMLDAGHPINADFELVRYSQGAVKHRFYEPDTSVNADMTSSELANLFVQGQLSQFLAASQSLTKSDHPDYKSAMQKRLQSAKDALSAVPAAAGFLANPSEGEALAVIDAIKDSDLSEAVDSLLPDPDSYIEVE